MKLNFKLGGRNQTVEPGTLDLTMIIGADATHPETSGNSSCPSMAGVVATNYGTSFQYLASARL